MMRQTDKASYTWVLAEVKALFESVGIQIELWLTDNRPALVNALQAVFVNPRIIINMCTWHMNKDVLSCLRAQLSTQFDRHREGRAYEDNDSTTELIDLHRALMDSPTFADCEARLADCERMPHEAIPTFHQLFLVSVEPVTLQVRRRLVRHAFTICQASLVIDDGGRIHERSVEGNEFSRAVIVFVRPAFTMTAECFRTK
ncbi:hypothetical protein E4U14_002627 [Claviceps sp. LM454 group G7]|nr:hypothetical protein E4U14_002627 [Claviceps sp. LM454 group G7]